LIGLGPAHRDQQACGFLPDVGQRERGQLGAAHRGGVAEQGDRGVADPDRGGAVDAREDLADVGGAQGPGEAARCGAVAAAQPQANLADGFGGDRIGESVHAVHVPDGGAGQVEAGHRDALGGACCQVGTQSGGVAG
jgi:hypothetical protein